jgi:ubiquitin-protein ligase
MMHDPRYNRLKADQEKIKELVLRSPFVRVLRTSGDPPSEYTFRLTCKGITQLSGGRPVFSEHHDLKITLSGNYPRSQPELTMLTPIFHPNFSGQKICIGHSYSPSMGLDDLVVTIIQMIRYENFNIHSPYNHEAVVWAERNARLIPLDTRQIVGEDLVVQVMNNITILDNPDDLLDEITLL